MVETSAVDNISNQEMLLNWDKGYTIGLKTCGDEFRCHVPASFCKNCIGTGIRLSYFTGKLDAGLLVPLTMIICHGENGAEIYRMKATPNIEMLLKSLRLNSLAD